MLSGMTKWVMDKKGPNVSCVFGHVVLINYFKHKHDKNYIYLQQLKANMISN